MQQVWQAVHSGMHPTLQRCVCLCKIAFTFVIVSDNQVKMHAHMYIHVCNLYSYISYIIRKIIMVYIHKCMLILGQYVCMHGDVDR